MYQDGIIPNDPRSCNRIECATGSLNRDRNRETNEFALGSLEIESQIFEELFVLKEMKAKKFISKK